MSPTFTVFLCRDRVNQMFWRTDEQFRSESNDWVVGPSVRPRVSTSSASCIPKNGVPVVALLSWSPRLPLLTCRGGWSVICLVILQAFVRIDATTPPDGSQVASGTDDSRSTSSLTRFPNYISHIAPAQQRLGPLIGSSEREKGPRVPIVGLRSRKGWLRPLLHAVPVFEPASYASITTITTTTSTREVIGSSRTRSRGRSHAREVRDFLILPRLQHKVITHLMDKIAVR